MMHNNRIESEGGGSIAILGEDAITTHYTATVSTNFRSVVVSIDGNTPLLARKQFSVMYSSGGGGVGGTTHGRVIVTINAGMSSGVGATTGVTNPFNVCFEQSGLARMIFSQSVSSRNILELNGSLRINSEQGLQGTWFGRILNSVAIDGGVDIGAGLTVRGSQQGSITVISGSQQGSITVISGTTAWMIDMPSESGGAVTARRAIIRTT